MSIGIAEKYIIKHSSKLGEIYNSSSLPSELTPPVLFKHDIYLDLHENGHMPRQKTRRFTFSNNLNFPPDTVLAKIRAKFDHNTLALKVQCPNCTGTARKHFIEFKPKHLKNFIPEILCFQLEHRYLAKHFESNFISDIEIAEHKQQFEDNHLTAPSDFNTTYVSQQNRLLSEVEEIDRAIAELNNQLKIKGSKASKLRATLTAKENQKHRILRKLKSYYGQIKLDMTKDYNKKSRISSTKSSTCPNCDLEMRIKNGGIKEVYNYSKEKYKKISPDDISNATKDLLVECEFDKVWSMPEAENKMLNGTDNRHRAYQKVHKVLQNTKRVKSNTALSASTFDLFYESLKPLARYKLDRGGRVIERMDSEDLLHDFLLSIKFDRAITLLSWIMEEAKRKPDWESVKDLFKDLPVPLKKYAWKFVKTFLKGIDLGVRNIKFWVRVMLRNIMRHELQDFHKGQQDQKLARQKSEREWYFAWKSKQSKKLIELYQASYKRKVEAFKLLHSVYQGEIERNPSHANLKILLECVVCQE